MLVNFKDSNVPKSWFSMPAMSYLCAEGIKHIQYACSSQENTKKISNELFENQREEPLTVPQRFFHFTVGVLFCIPLINLITVVALHRLGILLIVKPNILETPKKVEPQNKVIELPKREDPAYFSLNLKKLVLDYLADDDINIEKVLVANIDDWAEAAASFRSPEKLIVEANVDKIRVACGSVRTLMNCFLNEDEGLDLSVWIGQDGHIKCLNIQGIKTWFDPEREESGNLFNVYPFTLNVRLNNWDPDRQEAFTLKNSPFPKDLQKFIPVYLKECNLLAKQAWLLAEKNKTSGLKISNVLVQPWYTEFGRHSNPRQNLLFQEKDR